jgi:hypothetical protein
MDWTQKSPRKLWLIEISLTNNWKAQHTKDELERKLPFKRYKEISYKCHFKIKRHQMVFRRLEGSKVGRSEGLRKVERASKGRKVGRSSKVGRSEGLRKVEGWKGRKGFKGWKGFERSKVGRSSKGRKVGRGSKVGR